MEVLQIWAKVTYQSEACADKTKTSGVAQKSTVDGRCIGLHRMLDCFRQRNRCVVSPRCITGKQTLYQNSLVEKAVNEKHMCYKA